MVNMTSRTAHNAHVAKLWPAPRLRTISTIIGTNKASAITPPASLRISCPFIATRFHRQKLLATFFSAEDLRK